jgi:hypothetical protein
VTIGGGMACIGLSYDDLAKLQATGAGSAIWGLVLWLVERSSKRTGAEVSQKLDSVAPQVADKVAERIWEQIGGVQLVTNQTAAAVMQLSNGLATSESKQDKRHAENHQQIAEIIETQEEHGIALEHTMEAVASLKEGWQKPQLKKPKPQ